MSDEKDNTEDKEIDCLEAIGQLYAYLDGEISDKAQKSQMEHHLSHCKSCYSRSQMELAINTRLEHLDETDTPDELQDRLRNIIDKL